MYGIDCMKGERQGFGAKECKWREMSFEGFDFYCICSFLSLFIYWLGSCFILMVKI